MWVFSKERNALTPPRLRDTVVLEGSCKFEKMTPLWRVTNYEYDYKPLVAGPQSHRRIRRQSVIRIPRGVLSHLVVSCRVAWYDHDYKM